MRHVLFAAGLGSVLVLSSNAIAQGTPPPHPEAGLDAETLKKANDPMADTKAFNLQNYFVSSVYGSEVKANQLLLRYAQPAGRFLVRATLPLVTSAPPAAPPVSGFGDLNVFAIYTLPASPGNKLGIGPLIVVPTGSHDLGQGKVQVGAAALAFFAKSHVVQVGSLLQYQASVGGDEDRPDVSLLTAQMFYIWQAGAGVYLRSTGVWSFDLENDAYNIPIGLGFGKVIKAGSIVYNIFAEPQFSVLAEGAGQARFQTYAGFNAQF